MKKQVTTVQIWSQFRQRLLAFLSDRVGDGGDAEDLLQEVFLRIHKNASRLRQQDRLESWVFQITRNVLVDWYKAKQPLANADVETLQDLANRSEIQNLNDLVAGWLPYMIPLLPEKYRQAVSMYELDGKSQQQVADHFKISLSGAKSRIQRGRQQLKSILLQCCSIQFDQRGNVLDFQPNCDGSVNCQADECGCD